MWAPLIFLTAAVLVLLQFLWQERRHRRLRAKAREEFVAASLKQHRELNALARAQEEVLFNSMTEGVLVLGADGRIRIVNQSLLRLFGLSASIYGKTIPEVFRLPELSALAGRLPKEKRVLDQELVLPRDKPACLQVNASVIIGPDGESQGAIFVFHDLTRIRELENTRREFVANVSHELRTPLSLIKGFTETLLAGARDDPAVSVRFLQKIDRHADRLLFLIEDLLTVSRLESGQETPNREAVRLRDVADEVLDEMALRAREKQVAFENNIPEHLTVWADKDRLAQVFSNLIDNAVKYGRTGGRVRLDCSESAPQKTVVRVTDDGPGISPESLERIFERFYRVDKARSRESGGTGLGLAIVKHIIQAHGGEAWAESRPGHETVFSFSLPACPEAKPAAK